MDSCRPWDRWVWPLAAGEELGGDMFYATRLAAGPASPTCSPCQAPWGLLEQTRRPGATGESSGLRPAAERPGGGARGARGACGGRERRARRRLHPRGARPFRVPAAGEAGR